MPAKFIQIKKKKLYIDIQIKFIKTMSTSISLEFEHDSSDIDFNTFQICYHEKTKKKLLGNKIHRDEEQS